MRTSLLTFVLLLLTTGASMAGVLRVGSWTSSGSTPHSSLTSALVVSSAGDEIWVVKGLYQEAELMIPAGVSVYGGFIGSETNLSERNYATNVTILDGSGAHRVATVSGLLDGFTLRNGRTGDNGGGVLVKSGGVLSHCIAFANEAGYDGGGVFAEEGASVTNTLSANNRAGNDGAGISGARGYQAVNLTAVDNNFTDKPEVKKVLVAPASLTAGQVLNVTEPDILNAAEVDPHGSTILLKGWELDGHAIPMPYTVTYADNGKMLRFWAANAVGVGVSNEVALTVTWTVTSSAQLLTPKAVCEGTTLAAAGIGNPVFSPAPAGGATYAYSIDGTPISGLDYQLQYSDNGKLLTCEIKNADGTISGATTPAVRLAVMKAPEVLLANVPALSIEEGQPLCLPTPVVISNGSDITAQGWKWRIGAGGENTFNSCDKATTAMNNADIYYTAENGCSTAPAEIHFTTLTVTNPVGEFLQTVSALCSGMKLNDCISFADGGNTGDYYIGATKLAGNSWDDVKATALTVAHNLQVLRFSYNDGKNERRMTLTVHAVPEITTDPVTPGNALCLGDAHTLTIEATGDNISYQWERSINSTDGTDGDWDNVPGSTTAACRLTADVSAYYRCTVTGICIDKSTGVAGGKITSVPAQLTVNDRPVIPEVTFAANDLKICAGVEISTLLGSKVPTLTGTAAIDKGWTLGGIKIADDYKVLSTDNGKVLGYWASNDCGERTVTFPTGILAVTPRPELLQSPSDVATEENSSVRLSVLTGAGVKYEWYKAGINDPADPTDGATLIGGATSSSYVFTAEELKGADLTNGQKATEYYCKVIATTDVCKGSNADPTIDATDPAYVLSDVAKVTVSRRTTDITITSQPEAFPETCAGTDKEITVKATGRGNLTCTWYSGSTAMADPANGTIATTVSAIVPAPTNPLAADQELTSTFTPNAAGTYYCIIASTDNPGGVRSTQSVLTIHALPVLTDIPAGEQAQTLCKDSDLSVKVAATGVGVTYEWQKSTDNGTSYAPFGETDSRLRTAITGDALYRCVVKATCVEKATGYDNSANAKGLVSSSVTVTMATKPGIAPAAGFTPSAFSLCEGESIGLVDANITVTDNHKAVAPADRWWTLGGLQVASAYNVTRNDNGKTVGYSATNECGTTAVTFAAMKLTVDEKPQVTQDPVDVQTVEDSRVRLSVSASGSNLTYQWQKKANADADEDANWHDINVALEPSAATAAYSFTAANITAGAFDGADVLTDYRCVVGTTNACAATSVKSAPATVTVTRSKAAVGIRRQPASYEVCSSAAAPYAPGFTVEVEGSGHFVYSWYKIGGDGTPVDQTPASGLAADAVAAKTNTFQPSAAGTYYCVVTSTDDGVGVQTQAVTLTVSQAPVINGITPTMATICEGGSVTLGVDAVGSALTYQWYQQAGADPDPDADTPKGTAPTFTPVGLASTATFYCVVGSGSVCTETKTSNSVEVTIEKAPKITTQPVSQSVCGATGINLSVVAENTDTYQWYYNGTTTGTNSATLANVKDGGVYTCVVSKTGGVCGEATSVPALITVANSPEVKLGTATNLTACAGDLVTLASPVVEANGSVVVPGKTGWYLSTAADPDVAPVVSSCVVNTTATYNYKVTYKCSATSPEITVTAAMPVFTVTVNTPVAITSQPKDQNECNYTALTIAATGTPAPAYKWYYNGAAATTADIDNIAAQSATPKKDGVYTCGVSNACGGVMSAPAVVKKKAATAIATQPVAATICKGESVSLGVKATGDDLTYQWYSGTTNNPTTLISGATSATLSVSPAVNTYYKCTVSGCNSVNSNVVLVTVRAATAITALSGQPSGKVCNTATMPTLAVAATGDGTLAYQWYKDGAAIGGATNKNYAIKNTDLGSHNYEVRVTGNCGSLLSQAAAVEIVKAPVVSLPTAGITACTGDVITLPVPAIEANGSVIDQANTGWCLSSNETLVNSWKVNGTAATTWRYKVAYTCGTTAGQKLFSGNLTVTPNTAPTITAHPKDEVKCASDAFTSLSVTATGTAPSYQWYKDNATQSGATGSTYAVGQNAGVYHCVVSNACGTATSAPATLTRHAALAATAYADKTALCGSEATIVGVKVTAGAAASYQWDKAGTAINGATSSTMAVVGEDGTAAVSRTYNCTVTDVCGKTVKPSVTITHNPVPKITAQPVGGDVCDQTKELNVTATGAKSYQWYKNGGSISGATSASYTAPNTLGTNTYYCVVTSDQCGSVTSSPAVVTVAQAPTASAVSSNYWSIHNGAVPSINVPLISANGCVLSSGKPVYGSGKTDLSGNFSLTMDYQPVYYRVSYSGICSGTSDIAVGTLRGKVYDSDAVSGVIPDDGKMHIMIDSRDNKEYNIKKIKGGQVWMVQNLDYGACTMENNEANNKGNVQGITGVSGLMYGVCRSSADYGSAPKDGGKTYKYYNWQGAMQDADAVYNNSTNKSEWSNKWQGICPPGWHLPTKDEIQTMYTNVGSYANLTSRSDNNQSWAGVMGGDVQLSGDLWYATSWGCYWSSSFYTANVAYWLVFKNNGSVEPQYYFGAKGYGFAVRCLKN